MANYVDYGEKLKQLEQRKVKMINKLNRARKDAYDEACFYAGKMILECFDNDPEIIRWDKLEQSFRALKNNINDPATRDVFVVEGDSNKPGYNLAVYLHRD